MNPHVLLFNAVTEFDRRESRKKHYNRFALAHYARGLQRIKAHVDNGASLRDAIRAEFVGKLCDKLLLAVGLPMMTQEECRCAAMLPALPGDDD